jgi:hypothetical protein
MVNERITFIMMRLKLFLSLCMLFGNIFSFSCFICYLASDELTSCNPKGHPSMLAAVFGLYFIISCIFELYFVIKYSIEWYKNKDDNYYDDKY